MNDTTAVSKKPATTYTEVQMEDGRTVSFAGKKRLLKTTSTEGGVASVRFDVINGQTRTYTVSEAMLLPCAAHGASQKIGDEAAGLEDPDDIVVAIDKIVERLNAGDWGAAREPGDSFAGASTVIRAICEVKGVTPAQVKAFLDKKIEQARERGEALTRQKLYASFRNPTSATGKVIERLEREKAAKAGGVDADDLLSELE